MSNQEEIRDRIQRERAGEPYVGDGRKVGLTSDRRRNAPSAPANRKK